MLTAYINKGYNISNFGQRNKFEKLFLYKQTPTHIEHQHINTRHFV